VKKGISGDARYDAVGSSSLREELFEGYKKKLAMKSEDENGEDEKTRKERERKEKAEASLREREAKVREEKDRVGKEMGKSRAGAGREEGERLFGSLLVDQIRDHDVSSYTSWCMADLCRRHGKMPLSTSLPTHDSSIPPSGPSTSSAFSPSTSTDCLKSAQERSTPSSRRTPQPLQRLMTRSIRILSMTPSLPG
jgi:hypothetical protein